MNDQSKILSTILAKNKRLFLTLLDQMIEAPVEKLPMAEEIASMHDVNINTAKGVFMALADEGYIESRRRIGTRPIVKFSENKIESYRRSKGKIGNLLKSLEFAGFTELEMVACLMGAWESFSTNDNGIIYAESDYNELQIGQYELEQEIGRSITPRYINDLIEILRSGELRVKLIITTFYCEKLLEEFKQKIKIIPLKITPPLEQLLNFSLLPRDTYFSMVVLSNEIRKRYNSMYPNLVKDFPLFKIYTINEVVKDKTLINKVQIMLTLKYLYKEYSDLFESIPKVITYSRFQDREGIDFIKKILEES